jgi:thiopeptide-type bacteriocin biosynthesis protein
MALPFAAGWQAFHFFYHGDRDAALCHFVRPAVAELLAEGRIDRFFFLRHDLGGPHLRLRLRLSQSRAPGCESPEAGAALPAAAAAAAVAAVAETMERHAAAFLAERPSVSRLDPEHLRRQAEARHAAAPDPQGAGVFPDNTLIRQPFEPEAERYGGGEILGHSLDFFTLSSAHALQAIARFGDDLPRRRLGFALRALLAMAHGFAPEAEELPLLLSYRPGGQDRSPTALRMQDQADQAFEAQREPYMELLRRHFTALAEALGAGMPPDPGSAAYLGVAARRLAGLIRHVDLEAGLEADPEAGPEARRRIAASHLHMAANRLGLNAAAELYVVRLLWRAARDLAEADPGAFDKGTPLAGAAPSPERPEPLGELVALLLDRLASATAVPAGRS